MYQSTLESLIEDSDSNGSKHVFSQIKAAVPEFQRHSTTPKMVL